MKFSQTGQFYGVTNDLIHLDGITLTDTEYLQDRVPWHFHENNYFTFILEGGMIEANKKEVYECCAGDLLFHNWQDAHYNIASGRFTRGFHVEVGSKWFESLHLKNDVTEGSIGITDPVVKTLMYNIFSEMKLDGGNGQLGIDDLLLQIFGRLGKMRGGHERKKPKWVNKVEEMLRTSSEDATLAGLARLADVHPVHLSREFSRYFGMTMGDYVRAIKVQRALTLLPDRALSLTDISFTCGFSDQSHFIRSFKASYHITPLHYRKLLLKKE